MMEKKITSPEGSIERNEKNDFVNSVDDVNKGFNLQTSDPVAYAAFGEFQPSVPNQIPDSPLSKEYADPFESQKQPCEKVTRHRSDINQLAGLNKAILDNAGLAIISTDRNGYVQSFNNAAELMLGYSAKEVIGVLTSDHFHDPEELKTKATELTMLTGKELQKEFGVCPALLEISPTHTQEWTYIRKNGTRFPVKLTISSISDDQGVTTGFIGIAMDITHEKQLIESLRKSEERFFNMFYNHNSIMLLLNPESGKIVDANKAARKFYGYNFEHNGKMTISDISIQSWDILKKEMQHALNQKKNSFEYLHRLKTGEVRTVEIHSTPIEIHAEKLLFSIIHDITERKLIEESLHIANEKYRILLDESSDPIFSFSADGVYGYANKAFAIGVGKNQEEIIGRKISDVFSEEEAEKRFAAVKWVFENGEKKVIQVRVPRENEVLHFITTVQPIFNDQGEVIKVVCISKDITENQRSEEFMRLQHSLAVKLSTCTNLEKVMSFTIDSLMQMKNVDCGGIYLYNSVARCYQLMFHTGISDQFTNQIKEYGQNTRQAQLISSGVPIYGSYNQFDQEIVPKNNPDGITGIAIIPVVYEGIPIGTINLGSRTSIDFYRPAKEHLEAVAMQFSGAITRIKAENALHNSFENFKKLFDTIDDFIFILDTTGKILINNKVVENRLEFTSEELQGKPLLDLLPPSIHYEAETVLEEMLAGRKSYYLMSLCAKDGSFISVETRVTVGKWDDADVLFAISHDITERQNAEAALRMQSAAFESFALAIIITDIHGNIQWSNSAFSKLTGYDLDEVLGKRNAEFVKSGLQEDTFYQDMWSTILGGRVWSGELINKRKNGSLYPEELTITPILDFNGKVSGFIAIKIDISNRKKLEESLLQTISKEKELNELKSRFVSMASHEFRTPLSSILMSGETLMAYWKKLDEEQINAKLQNIRDQVQHLGILVTDVMQVSKIQEGKLTIEQQKIDLIAICHDVIYNFDNDELANSINKIELKCDFEILNMFLDNRQIVQALNNLISNAVKYAEPDPIIKIRIWQEGQEILLSVQDNGIGIPEEDQKYLFQPFYRASNARQIQGNGLGLNIVRESMHLHGGEITFVSYPGRGTTFTLHFPKKLVLKP